MTLEEAIKLEEEVTKDLSNVDESELDLMYCGDTECINAHIDRCIKYAEEHEQIAEWLKDYKRLKEQEHCEDCVSREQALLALTGKNLSNMNVEESIVLFNKRIKALSSVTPTQKTGHWIVGNYHVKCSVCGEDYPYRVRNYCPNCGARMKEASE